MRSATFGVLLAVSAGVLSWISSAASGQCFSSRDAVEPPTVGTQTRFGSDVAVKGQLAVVGQPFFPVRKAHVYEWTGSSWALMASLSDPEPVSGFSGYSVDTDGTRVIVGAAFGPSGASVLIFRREGNGFVQEARLTPAGAGANGSYGTQVAIDGDLAALRLITSGASAVDIYRRINGVWVLAQSISDPTPQQGIEFVTSLDLSSGHLVIGSVQDESITEGAVFVYERVNDVLSFQQRLLASGPGGVRNLGHAVAIDGGTIVASAGFDPGISQDVHVFTLSGGVWSQSAIVPRRDQANWQGFGDSLALSGDLLAIGSSAHDAVGTDSGAVFIYRRSGSAWVPVTDLPNPSPVPAGDFFGDRVALSEGRLLAAASGDGDDGALSGAVYSFFSGTVGFTQVPTDQSVALGQPAMFSASATGQGALSYRWKIGGVVIPSGLAPYQDVNTPTLTVSSAAESLVNAISVEVTDGCGFSAISPAASLTVTPPGPACPGDANGDGVVQFIDITTVLSNFGVMCR
jgi:hypothetical protein